MSLTRRTRRSVLPVAMSSICCSFSGRALSEPPVIRPSAARSEVSGVRSSCETVEMNSSFMRSRARRSVVSVKATTTPTALPPGLPSAEDELSVADWISIWGRATYSTGKLVPSLRQKTSLATRTVARSRMLFWIGHSSAG